MPGAPPAVRAAAKDALDNTVLGYTVALGIPELRAAIAALVPATGTASTVDPDDVVITTGSSGGFLLAFLACFDVGDRVAIASPGYPCYRNILSALGCEVVEIPAAPRPDSSRPRRCSPTSIRRCRASSWPALPTRPAP